MKQDRPFLAEDRLQTKPALLLGDQFQHVHRFHARRANGLHLDAVFLQWHFGGVIRPVNIKALPGYKIRVDYADGVTGVVDLSDSVGRGVFAPLLDEAFFKKVHVGDHGQIAWTDEIEICPDAAYLEITGKISREAVHA